jgi:fatty acid desaturase
MKYSSKDLALVFIAVVEFSLLLLPFLISLPPLVLLFLIIFQVYLVGVNYQCIAHNFIHHPFFTSQILNSFFSILNTLILGIPQSLYRIHHLNHHRFNNHPEKDESSTYRYGKDGNEENIFAYSFLGIFRTDLVALYKVASKYSSLVHIELLSLLSFITLLVFNNWMLALGYVFVIYLLGQVFALWENYCEHHLANYNDRKRDSVSCYNPLYNILWFNNGYHQEHHFSPQVHWTEISTITEKLPSDRVITSYCHLFHSFKERS